VGVLLNAGRRGRTPWALALAATLGASACARTTHPDGTFICDTHLPTGAMSAAVAPLSSPGPSPADGPAPTGSQLPPAAPAPPDYLTATYLRTSPSCARGAVVVIQPAGHAQLVVTVPASDGALAAVGLKLTGEVTVRSWVGGVFAGSAVLP
jgi:hypothetical protein